MFSSRREVLSRRAKPLSAPPWPAELEGDFLTGTDPEFGEPEAHPLPLAVLEERFVAH